MEIFKTVQDFANLNPRNNKSIGFAPTMGNLHDGHISLLERALNENDIAIMSIYVNPTQFGAGEDFDRYPRTWETDLQKIDLLAQKYPKKRIIVFYPENNDVIYPPHTNIFYPASATLKKELEGALRPTHFDGVVTVVKRLFDIVKPDRAYFGKKDYQQFIILKEMVHDLKLPIDIIGMDIIRESDGLAMSSRNQYLSKDDRKEALVLSQTLKEIAKRLQKDTTSAMAYIKEKTTDRRWNYLEIRNAENLSAPNQHTHLIILGNLKLGTTKLLDNLEIEIKNEF